MIVLSSGGLGNQLFVYAACLHIAESQDKKITMLSNNKEFVKRVEEQNRKHCDNNKVRVIFGEKTHTVLNQVIGKFEKYREKQTLLPNLLFSRVLTLSEPWHCPNELFSAESQRYWIIRGFFQDVELIQMLSEQVKSVLQELIMSEFQSPSQMSRRQGIQVGVHIRRGDYEFIEQYGTLSESYFSSCLDKIERRIHNFYILVSSDSAKSLDEIQFDGNVTKLYPNNENAWECLGLLASSSIFIMSNSTFSFWIGWAVSRKGGQVFAPHPWFKKTRVPESYLYLPEFEVSNAIFD